MVAARKTTPDVRAAVLAAATRHFAARGFDGTSLQDVADAVGVTKPAVLHHFPSKDALREAVLAAMLAHWTDQLPRLLLAATRSEDRFAAVYGELHRFFAADADRARLVVRELLDRPDEMRRVMKGAVRPWLEAVAGYIRAGQEAGRHHADVDPEAYVVHVLQMVISAASAASVTAALLDGDGAARLDAELFRLTRSALFVDAPAAPPRRARPPKSPRSTRTASR